MSRRNIPGLNNLCVVSAAGIYNSVQFSNSAGKPSHCACQSQTSLYAWGISVKGDPRTQNVVGRDLESVHKSDPYK